MKHLRTFETAANHKIFIDSEPIEDIRHLHHKNIDDAYTTYEKSLKNFSYNNVKVDQAKGDVSGDDFKGFDADLEILLSNHVLIQYVHAKDGKGTFSATTAKGTFLFSEEFDLVALENGYANVLINLIKKVLDFKF